MTTPGPSGDDGASSGRSTRKRGLVGRVVDEVRSGPEQRRYATLAIVAVLVLYVVGLLVANSRQVRISFVLGSTTISLLWLIILCVTLGGVIGWIVRGRYDRPRRKAAEAPPERAPGAPR